MILSKNGKDERGQPDFSSCMPGPIHGVFCLVLVITEFVTPVLSPSDHIAKKDFMQGDFPLCWVYLQYACSVLESNHVSVLQLK